jgi:hypothetical protein
MRNRTGPLFVGLGLCQSAFGTVYPYRMLSLRRLVVDGPLFIRSNELTPDICCLEVKMFKKLVGYGFTS